MENKKYLWLLPIRSILFILVFLFIAGINNISINNTAKWWTLAVNVVNIITLIILWTFCIEKKITFMQLFNLEKVKCSIKDIIIGAIIVAVLALLGMNLTGFIIYKELPYNSDIIMQAVPLILAIINIIILPITSTLAEEGLYLGIGVNQIENKKLGIIIPLFFYMLQHSFFPFILDIKFILFRFLSFFFMILWICLYYQKSKKVMPIIVGHFITNFVTAIQILLLSL